MDLDLSLTIWPSAFCFIGVPGQWRPCKVLRVGVAGAVYKARSLHTEDDEVHDAEGDKQTLLRA